MSCLSSPWYLEASRSERIHNGIIKSCNRLSSSKLSPPGEPLVKHLPAHHWEAGQGAALAAVMGDHLYCIWEECETSAAFLGRKWNIPVVQVNFIFSLLVPLSTEFWIKERTGFS